MDALRESGQDGSLALRGTPFDLDCYHGLVIEGIFAGGVFLDSQYLVILVFTILAVVAVFAHVALGLLRRLEDRTARVARAAPRAGSQTPRVRSDKQPALI